MVGAECGGDLDWQAESGLYLLGQDFSVSEDYVGPPFMWEKTHLPVLFSHSP